MSKAMTSKDVSNAREELELKRGPWTLEEDSHLIQYIACHGEGRWNTLAKCAGLKRTGKSCRLRWLNYLKPDIKRGNLTIEEQLLILQLHSQYGNRWSKIAQHLPGRTDNEIKNYWRTRVQKHTRQLKIHSDSKTVVEAIQCIRMPRLMEQNSSPPPPPSPSSCSTSSNMAIPFPLPLSSFQPSIELDSENPISVAGSTICFSGIPESPNHAFQNTANSCSLLSDIYHMDNCGYDYMEEFNMATKSAVGPCDFSASDSQVAGKNWISDDGASIVWNVEELWQL